MGTTVQKLPVIQDIATFRSSEIWPGYGSPIVYLQGGTSLLDGSQCFYQVNLTDKTSADNGSTCLVDAGGNRWFQVTTPETVPGGLVTVPEGGTGVATLTSHGVLIGNGVSPVTTTAAGTTTTVLHGNASGDPTFGAVVLTTDVSGTLPVANGGTGVIASSGANSVVLRDANQNASANVFLDAGASTAGAGTTTTLTVASARQQTITGTLGQTFKLPDATTLPNGDAFYFNNNGSSGTLTVQNTGAGAITTVPITGYAKITLLDNSTANGTWDNHAWAPSNATWGSAGLNISGSFVLQTNATTALTVDTSQNLTMAAGKNVVTSAGGLVTGVLTNSTGLPVATGISGLGTGVATFLATPSSANLASALTDETGTGAAVFANAPTLINPVQSTAGGGAVSYTMSGEGSTTRDARRYSTDTTPPQTIVSKARGTIASATAVAQFDEIGRRVWNAYDGSAFQNPAYETVFVQAATPSSSNMESDWRVFICPASSVTPTEILRARHSSGVRAFPAMAIPAGGTAGAGFTVSSTANFGVFFGSGAPTLAAAKGSLYLRSDGTTTNNRAYINTDGSTTWTALTTAA